ncbi:hypothetical protein DICPUDRAFT_147163 [Dictyostelium purpureum]|uniref:EamA domain-containing protein n=1 Tax=Dictyostelium purpureum TaxID=5786 RepID=F0Z7T8_DICPU|nr:uncharacterized protein DICPUDRAFT_147163 [Dictyostelium purpureum]EGC40002.1 hypothetical protein DICPUDRAFT_147163 [Dictyostelium purpureum]|eukprot:XP_003283505.1 hypothetical protein DICPUDRAFT_147163 [Dictyostelium purpureum]
MDMTLKGRIKQSIRSCTFKDFKVHLVLLSVCLVFSVFYIITKKTLNQIDVWVFLTLRLAIATPILWICAFIVDTKEMLKLPNKKELLFLSLSGILSVTVNQSLFLLGLSLSTASNAAITQPAIPVFSTVFGVLLGFERKTKLKFLGIATAVIGCVLMVDFTHLTSENSSSRDILLGNLCFLGNTVAYAVFLMVQKPLGDRGISAIKIMAWSFGIGSPPVILFGLLYTDNISHAVASITVWPWMAILYCAILATAYCFFASSWAVAKSNAVTVSVYLCVEPLATGILATIFLPDEILTLLNIFGGIVMVCGVALVMVSKYREKKKDELDNFEKEKLKRYDMNNSAVELNTLSPEAIINISKENSYSKIISSNSIINESDENEEFSDNKNQEIEIDNINDSNNNNNNNNFNNNINIQPYFNGNNLLNQFKQEEENEDNDQEINLNDSIDDSIKGGGNTKADNHT